MLTCDLFAVLANLVSYNVTASLIGSSVKGFAYLLREVGENKVLTKTRPAGRPQTSTVIGGKRSRGTKSNWPAAF